MLEVLQVSRGRQNRSDNEATVRVRRVKFSMLHTRGRCGLSYIALDLSDWSTKVKGRSSALRGACHSMNTHRHYKQFCVFAACWCLCQPPCAPNGFPSIYLTVGTCFSGDVLLHHVHLDPPFFEASPMQKDDVLRVLPSGRAQPSPRNCQD